MTGIKAIETVYNGHRYRSRLEARWAIVLTKLGIDFLYEYEGYDLGVHGWYLPDFYLPKTNSYLIGSPGVFFEIKPDSNFDSSKVYAFSSLSEKPILVFCGKPDVVHGVTGSSHSFESFGDYECVYPSIVVCPYCRTSSVVFPNGKYADCQKCGESCETPAYYKAVTTANKARFDGRD